MAAGASNPQKDEDNCEQRGKAYGPDVELCFVSLCQPKIDAYRDQGEDAGHVDGWSQGDSSLYLLAECHGCKPTADAIRRTVTRPTYLQA
jgi:hypothetical protein